MIDNIQVLKSTTTRSTTRFFAPLFCEILYWYREHPTEEDRWVERTEKVNEYNKPFSWDGGSKKPEVEILPAGDGFINICRFLETGWVRFAYHGPEKDRWAGEFKFRVDVKYRDNKKSTSYQIKAILGYIDTIESKQERICLRVKSIGV